MLTSSDVARILNVSPTRVRQLEAEGLIVPKLRTPLGRLYERREIERFRDERHRRGLGRRDEENISG
jgi:DNA-binding transcriptional MerR regulator